jgi:hypothetical protein
MAGRALWTLFLVLLLAGACVAAAADGSSDEVRPAALRCGGFRQHVKTLQDRRARLVKPTPVPTNVRALRAKRKPRHDVKKGTPRKRGVERTTYTLKARLVGARREGDHDIHLVIAGTAKPKVTMIVEFPDVRCARHASQSARNAMGGARFNLLQSCGPIGRKKFKRLKGTATITGVGFFDSLHKQRGVAPNGIEIHPVLGFQASGCAP